MTTTFSFQLTDSLEKVLPKQQPRALKDNETLSGLYGEKLSFQFAYYCESDEYDVPNYKFKLQLNSELAEHMSIRKVELVPCSFPCYGVTDEHYITTEPGLLPDLLTPLNITEPIKAIPTQWRAIWIDIDVDQHLTKDQYSIHLQTVKLDGTPLWERQIYIKPIKQRLPEQKLLHTEWFHADCLADYYKVDVFSEQHWEIVEHFMRSAAEHGVNMLLTPIFTPPLDTAIGGERTTIQLVEVVKTGEHYSFHFNKLERWISLCLKHGITNIEISHLITQWGAEHAPKIIATVNGKEEQLFGWHMSATEDAYLIFLNTFIPQLKAVLKKLSVFERTWFHISDEPHDHQKATYKQAKNAIAHLLSDCRVIDALSSIDIYKEGIVEQPIVCIDKIEPFIEDNVQPLWAYYCCVQALKVSNRFIAMPSARNRILGILLYLYRIQGFLHWGFNFYNAQHSTRLINPYLVTDADEAFPSGDPFLVYPAPDGTAYESIRGMVLKEALFDLRALELLESKIGREEVEKLIHKEVNYQITFNRYPMEEQYIISLRQEVNARLQQL